MGAWPHMSLTRIDSPREVVQKISHQNASYMDNGHWDLGMWLCSVVLLNLNHLIRWHIITLLVIAISIVLPHCLCHIIQLIVSICTQCVGSFINSKWPIVKAFYGSNCLMDRCILCNGQQKTNYVSCVYYRENLKKTKIGNISLLPSLCLQTFTFYAGRRKCNTSRICCRVQ